MILNKRTGIYYTFFEGDVNGDFVFFLYDRKFYDLSDKKHDYAYLHAAKLSLNRLRQAHTFSF